MESLLICTNIQNIFEKNSNIYLLGKWCDAENLGKNSCGNKFQTIKYHWDDNNKYLKDYLYLNDLYERYLKTLSGLFDEIHGEKNGIKYWRIIIGPWLRHFCDVVFDRYQQVSLALEKYNLRTNLFEYEKYEWIHNDFETFYQDIREDDWNQILISEIWKYLNGKYKIVGNLKRKNIKKKNKIFTLKAKSIINKVSFMLSKEYKYIFISSHIRNRDYVHLNYKLGQIPARIYQSRPKFSDEINLKIRNKIIGSFKVKSNFENFLAKSIGEWVPRIHLEDYKLNKTYTLKTYPKNPKIIFTANAYLHDELFKIWVGEKCVKNSSRLLIGQHGGFFGSAKVIQEEDHQIEISDTFISWGWDKSHVKNIKPMESFKLCEQVKTPNLNGDILLATASYPKYFYSYYSAPIAGQNVKYLRGVEYFLNNLNDEVRSLIKIRIQKNEDYWQFSKSLDRGNYNFPIEDCKIPFKKRLEKSRLFISTANSTLFLETLSNNFPTVCFMDKELFNLRDEAIHYFESLTKVGILFYDFKSAARSINDQFSNISDWWNDKNLQNVRREFCDRFAFSSKKYIHNWSQYLKEYK